MSGFLVWKVIDSLVRDTGHMTHVIAIGYLTMKDYSSYTLLNGNELESLSNYQRIPTVSQWPAQQPIAGLFELEARSTPNNMPGALTDCLVTIGMIMILLLSSSLLLGLAMDQLTQEMVMLMQESTTELG